MKTIFYFLLFLMVSCVSSSDEEATKLKDKNIIELLIFGEPIDLNKIQIEKEKGLWLKLYKVPNTEHNDCFPESHGICNYKYYLATSQLDDSPIINAYYLGVLGEVVDYSWQDLALTDVAKINITANKYSKNALSYNKKLKNQVTVYEITVTPDNISIVKLE